MPDQLIGIEQIAESLRYVDAISEEHQDQPRFWRERGVDVEGLMYVAMQSGLRSVMIIKGMNPNITKRTPVALTPDEVELQVKFAAAFFSGCAVGMDIQKKYGPSSS